MGSRTNICNRATYPFFFFFKDATGATGKDKSTSPEPISTAWNFEILVTEGGNSDMPSDTEAVF